MNGPKGHDHVVIDASGRRRAVIDIINSARTRLLLSVFRCDDRAVIEALAAACRRNVRVEAIVTSHADAPRTSLRLLRILLEQIGVCVWRYDDPLMKYHSKYIVADGASALIGSLNFTRKCFKKTSDFLVVSRDPDVVRGLTALFEADRESRHAVLPEHVSSRLIVCPGDARQRLRKLFAKAQRSIRIIDAKLTDEPTIELLKTRSNAGVNVQMLTGKRIVGLASHGKLVILDDHTAIVGSMSLSSSSLDARREVAIAIHAPRSVADLASFFDDALRFERPYLVLASSRESIA